MSHSLAPRRRAAAFTLVELLVVIGIIALLISILLPSLNKAREAANRVACGSNMRQIGLSFFMYHDKYKALPPGSWLTNAAVGFTPGVMYMSWDDQMGWGGFLFQSKLQQWQDYQCLALDARNYSMPVLQCPSDSVPRPATVNIGSGTLIPPIPRSYAMVSAGFAGGGNTPGGTGGYSVDTRPNRGVKLSQVPAAAQTILLIELAARENYAGMAGEQGAIVDHRRVINATDFGGNITPFLHSKPPQGQTWKMKTNYLFADGHVELLQFDETLGYTTVGGVRTAVSAISDSRPKGMWTRDRDD
jgi:prepilin-type processing-associated H-X9-DG protein